MPEPAAQTDLTDIGKRIVIVRGQRVLLDTDLAMLYGVTPKRLNEQVRRNLKRFPPDFLLSLEINELRNLRSQFATSSLQHAESTEVHPRWSQIVITSHGGRRYCPWAFTEHGAVMAANILRSERAVQMSVFVVRAFVRLREHVAANHAILKRLAEIDRTLLEHDTALLDVYEKLLPLLQPPPDAPTRRIGFHSKGKS